jgi:hypothetical protein
LIAEAAGLGFSLEEVLSHLSGRRKKERSHHG